MKREKLFLLIIVLFFLLLNLFAPVPSVNAPYADHISMLQAQIDRNNAKLEFERFLDSVAFSESSNNPHAYNKYGYIGKYQFGNAALKSCGYDYIRYSEFVKNPTIWSEEQQDSAMITLLSKNERHLKDIIHIYNGHVIEGMVVTKSGILAAAHLAGATGVKNYFNHGVNPQDAYGTRLQDYLIRFSGFNF